MPESSVDSNTFQELIARLRRGDDDALTALIQYNSQRLDSLARQMLRGYPALRRWVETNDVLQNSYMRLLRAIQTVEIESPRHFMALSALQIRRELIDLVRHYYGPEGPAANHESRAGEDSKERENMEVVDFSNEPNTLSQWCELHEQIGDLPEREREVVNLLYYDGLSRTEAAKILDISIRTLQRRWHAALLILHEKVAGQWPQL